MINLEEIQKCNLTSQEIYDMINSCIEAAEDNGFLNQFVFERALACHGVLNLLDVDKDEIGPMVACNPLEAFDYLLKEGLLAELIETYESTMNYIGSVAVSYFADYEKYLLSVGGVLNKAEIFSSEVLQNMAGQVKNVMDNEDIKQTLHIADEWGMNRTPEEVAAPVDSEQVLNSLFNVVE